MFKITPSQNMLKIINCYRIKNNLEPIQLNQQPYKTHQGKTYTQEEWEAYEQEQWEKYKNGKKK